MTIEPFQEYYPAGQGKTPSGEKWEAYLALVTLNGAMQRLFALPPGAPPAAVAALRAALGAPQQRQGLSPPTRSRPSGYVPEYDAGPETNDTVRAALMVRPEIRTFVADYIKLLGK